MNGHRRRGGSREKSSVAEACHQEPAESDVFSFFYSEWHTMTSAFPLMAAAFAPVSNLFSITALAEPWVIELTEGEFLPDRARTAALNAVSLAFGVLASVSLLANFTGRVKYSPSQAICITSRLWA
ncbi:hypothetical protein V1507DRAFT_63618 [Lipomyces tetrasporus]